MMEKGSGTYVIGVGGWEHVEFDRFFYPHPKADSLEKLKYYAGFFDTVEVRSTFWDDSLGADDAQRWVDSVERNRRFVFNVKLHLSFTHKKEVRHRLTRATRSMLQELGRNDRLGGLLIQFPYPFTNTSTNRFYVVRLAEIFSGFPVYVEFRHDSWYQPAIRDFLAENLVHPVSADIPRIRHYMPFTTWVIGETAYLRLHGRNERGWMLGELDTRYDYLYNAREMRELVRRIEGLSEKCRQIIVVCNNTTGGKAIANALELISALRNGKRVLAPHAAVRAFPYLSEIASMEDDDSLLAGQGYRQVI
jgi:uncharacterized protein YecE (DUF72 family)